MHARKIQGCCEWLRMYQSLCAESDIPDTRQEPCIFLHTHTYTQTHTQNIKTHKHTHTRLPAVGYESKVWVTHCPFEGASLIQTLLLEDELNHGCKGGQHHELCHTKGCPVDELGTHSPATFVWVYLCVSFYVILCIYVCTCTYVRMHVCM